MARQSICYVLSYYSPNYVRSETLVGALSALEGFKLIEVRNTSKGIFRYAQTLTKLAAARLLHNPDVYVLGFRGHEIFWPVRLMTLGKTLVFDEMMSPFDSLVNETKKLSQNSPVARFIFAYEKSALQCSQLILTDTVLNKEYFCEAFGIVPEKVFPLPVSADEDIFRKVDVRNTDTCEQFSVLFYGSFLPLHGVDIILESAILLRELPIHFTLIGGSRGDSAHVAETVARNRLTKVQHKRWIAYQRLPDVIGKSSICLGGPFGNTGQARRVVTGKTYQCLAMGMPTVIGRIDEDYGFADKENCLLVQQGDARALAEAIAWAWKNQKKLGAIGRKGWELYLSRFSTSELQKRLRQIFVA